MLSPEEKMENLIPPPDMAHNVVVWLGLVVLAIALMWQAGEPRAAATEARAAVAAAEARVAVAAAVRGSAREFARLG